MIRDQHEQAVQRSQLKQVYEQQWQAHLLYETKARLALEARQKEEEAQSYLYEINLLDRAMLVSRQLEERKALAYQHRAMRIALCKIKP
ncbi:hypothetical protein A6C57_00350 [Fibrella sp. ES10-3-2-2]|nr:hypothetical protein A6C57_00350 [Fibrella sp. ES10-3-2-2]